MARLLTFFCLTAEEASFHDTRKRKFLQLCVQSMIQAALSALFFAMHVLRLINVCAWATWINGGGGGNVRRTVIFGYLLGRGLLSLLICLFGGLRWQVRKRKLSKYVIKYFRMLGSRF